MQLTGTLKEIRETQQITDKFQKREFVVVTNEQYPQFISLELQGDKCDIIDSYGIGEEVVCDLNLRGREWVNPQGETKYFNTIVAWKIQRPANSAPAPSVQTQNTPKEYPQANQPNSFVDGQEDDQLPF
jgi:hypothetical protein